MQLSNKTPAQTGGTEIQILLYNFSHFGRFPILISRNHP
jgi:hypothetical protein